MEKYRKFDDASCGINPFVPLPEEKRSVIGNLIRNVKIKNLYNTVALNYICRS